jgi:hypothetical protein
VSAYYVSAYHYMCPHTDIPAQSRGKVGFHLCFSAVLDAALPSSHLPLYFIPTHARAHTQPPRAHIHALLKRFIPVWCACVYTLCVCVCVRVCACAGVCVLNTRATRIPAQHIPSRSIGSWRCDRRLLLVCAAGTLSLACPCSVLFFFFVTILHFCRIAFELQGDTVVTFTFWPLFLRYINYNHIVWCSKRFCRAQQ